MSDSDILLTAEKPAAPTSYRMYLFVMLLATTLTLYLLYDQAYSSEETAYVIPTQEYIQDIESKYLVWSSQCKIPNLNPFNEEVKHLFKAKSYTKCSNKPLLTYTRVLNNTASLYINQAAKSRYTKNEINCCYSRVIREKNKNNPDGKIKSSSCKPFTNQTILKDDVVLVQCKDNTSTKPGYIYKNVHSVITIHKTVQKKIENNFKENHLSVLLIGIDSVSRLNLMRGMPKTHKFLTKNGWLELKGYNKVADNTFPNLMGILTGMDEDDAYNTCKPKEVGYLDRCKILWYDYRDLGYVTGYAEDDCDITTFNFHKKGFTSPPTDYYFRPYIMATENYLSKATVDDMPYCTGPETAGERILHVGKEFAERFQNHPYFGFFWMNTFSHNVLHAISRMDNKVNEFLADISKRDILNNTIVVFFSDHGFRFGSIRYTTSGWLEERLPFFFVRFPKWFQQVYPEKHRNFITNGNRLTNPYDFYMTLQDILVMEGKNYTVKKSRACPKCKSMFEPMDVNRSCKDASIAPHWCTCDGYTKISTKNSTVLAAVDHVIHTIHWIIDSHKGIAKRCARYKLNKVMGASVSQSDPAKHKSYLLVVIETSPKAVFEATVSIEMNNTFKMQGGVSRLDWYASSSGCINDAYMKKYCYCHR